MQMIILKFTDIFKRCIYNSKINQYDLLQNVEVLYPVILLPNRNWTGGIEKQLSNAILYQKIST